MTVIDVQLVPVPAGAAGDPVLAGCLAGEDWKAVRSLGFAPDRDRAVTARAAARLELGRRLGVHPRLVPLVAPAPTNGMPVVEGSDLRISWSHSGAWVALALARGLPVGVDIEAIPRRVPTKALAAIGLGSIEEFVAREAAGKAAGEGLHESSPPDVDVRPFEAPTGYLGAVAAPGCDGRSFCGPSSEPSRPRSPRRRRSACGRRRFSAGRRRRTPG